MVTTSAGRRTHRAALFAGLVLAASCATSCTTSGVTGTVDAPQPTGSYAEMAQAVLAEVNRVRTDPQGYAASIEALLQYYDGTILRRPGEVAIQTKEGRAAAEEAIRVLRAQSPLPPLSWSPGMARGAQDHVNDIGPRGIVGHIGSDGSTPSERVNRYGSWIGTISENIDFGPSKAVIVVQDFVIDDGVPDRGHRHNVLDPVIRVAGAACGPHRVWGTACVVDHAAGYRER